VSVSDLDVRIAALGNRVEGITLTGGEPFEQARSLAQLAEACRARGLSVATYSGFGARTLLGSHRSDWRALLAATDLLLAGPFRADLPETKRPWVGSRNQVLLPLTDRYRAMVEAAVCEAADVEWRIDRGGGLSMNGMAPESMLRKVHFMLARMGVQIRGAGREGL